MAGSGVLARRWVSCLAQLPFLLLLLVARCGGGGEGSAPPPLLFRFIVGADQLPALLAQLGVVLLAAGSKYETQPFGFVNGAVLVDVDAWADFSFTLDQFSEKSKCQGPIRPLAPVPPFEGRGVVDAGMGPMHSWNPGRDYREPLTLEAEAPGK